MSSWFSSAPVLNPSSSPPSTTPAAEFTNSSPLRRARQYEAHHSDTLEPLLRDLSPTRALRVLTIDAEEVDDEGERRLVERLMEASKSERAFGVRVARCAGVLREWVGEVGGWDWPGQFDASGSQGGSVPEARVREYDHRLEEIREELEELDVEELKGHVLDVHVSSRSRPTSGYAGVEPFDVTARYQHLDEFTALVTAVILQCLPNLALLTQLLGTWSARLAVLKVVPGYLEDLGAAREMMKSNWKAISPEGGGELDMVTFQVMRDQLQEKLARSGQRLDSMLDSLEGREETLPDEWIDGLEALEADYSNWVIDAERRVLQCEWSRQRRKAQEEAERQHAQAAASVKEETTEATHEQPMDVPTSFPTQPELPQLDGSKDLSSVAVTEVPTKQHPSHIDIPLLTHRPADVAKQTAAPDNESRISNGLAAPFMDSKPSPALSDMSDLSTPDVQQASALEYFRVQEALAPPPHLASRSSSTRTITPIVIRRRSTASVDMHTPTTPICTEVVFPSLESSAPPVSPSPTSPTSPSFPESPPPSSPTALSVEDSPSARSFNKRPTTHGLPPALNAMMAKRRGRAVDDSQKGADTPSILEEPPTLPPAPTGLSGEEQLELQISNILTTIPADIRLVSSTKSELQPPSSRSNLRTASNPTGRPSPAVRPPRLSTGPPALTLSPVAARDVVHSRKSANDNHPEIKLYHLSQPGKEQPIKLFVRLVGEHGERVMVRVGGGWADLGEYLRQYAEHHGRRTVSEGKFDLQTALSPTLPSANGKGKAGRTPLPSSRPGSVLDQRPGSSGRGTRIPSTPLISNSFPTASTPVAANDGNVDEASPPSAASVGSRTSSRLSWTGDEVGLAGPAAKKTEMSAEKQKWVEDMIERARKASSGTLFLSGNREKEGNKEAQEGFGSLGKVGGTKRVWMKGLGGFGKTEKD